MRFKVPLLVTAVAPNQFGSTAGTGAAQLGVLGSNPGKQQPNCIRNRALQALHGWMGDW